MVQDRTQEETFRWAANSPWGQRVTDLAHSESACPPSRPRIHPLEKLSWRRVGRGAPGASGRLSTPAGFLGSHSLGYREIFISRRWAPAAPEAEHAATIRKPSHPRDKDRSVTHRDPAWQGQPQATWPSAEKPPRPPPARGRGLCCRPRGMRAEDGDGRTHREKHRGGEKGSVLTPRRLLRIRTYPCFTMSLKLEAILDGRDPPSPRRPHPKRLRGGFRAGSGADVGGESWRGEAAPAAARRGSRRRASLCLSPKPRKWAAGSQPLRGSAGRAARRGEAGAPPSADSSAGLPGGGAAAAQGSSPASSRGLGGGGRGGGGGREGGGGGEEEEKEGEGREGGSRRGGGPPRRRGRAGPSARPRPPAGRHPLSAPHPSPPLPPTWPDPLPLPIPPLLPDPERAPARPRTSRTAWREHAPSLLAPVFDFWRRGNSTLSQPPPTPPLSPIAFPRRADFLLSGRRCCHGLPWPWHRRGEILPYLKLQKELPPVSLAPWWYHLLHFPCLSLSFPPERKFPRG